MRYLIALLFLASVSFADSGNEVYKSCVAKGQDKDMKSCYACCSKGCYDTNFGHDIFGFCTRACQKNCKLFIEETEVTVQ